MTKYGFKIFNGRVKIYVDDYVMFTFNQIDFKGYYAYKDDTLLYGLDVYLMNEKGGATTMEIYFKTKEYWLGILKLLDENLLLLPIILRLLCLSCWPDGNLR